jgi:hypothetical protein
MNKLCISKLLQVVDGELVPSEPGNGEASMHIASSAAH